MVNHVCTCRSGLHRIQSVCHGGLSDRETLETGCRRAGLASSQSELLDSLPAAKRILLATTLAVGLWWCLTCFAEATL